MGQDYHRANSEQVLAIGGFVRIGARCYFELAGDGQLEIHDSRETGRVKRLQVPFRRPYVQSVGCLRHGLRLDTETLPLFRNLKLTGPGN